METTQQIHALELMPVASTSQAASLPVSQMAPASEGTPLQLLQYAMANGGASLDQLERLMAMQERYLAGEARKAYVAAMAEFKRKAPVITKNKMADFTTQKGRTTYNYSDLANVVRAVVPALAEYGFSHAWSILQGDGAITVTCRLTHSAGHSEEVTLSAAPDQSGGKNSIQAIGSAKSYLERYTLLAACGLAVEDGSDDDGMRADLDARPADEWIGKVNACKTDADVLKVWEEGSAALVNQKQNYAEFKDAVATRRGQLQEGKQ